MKFSAFGFEISVRKAGNPNNQRIARQWPRLVIVIVLVVAGFGAIRGYNAWHDAEHIGATKVLSYSEMRYNLSGDCQLVAGARIRLVMSMPFSSEVTVRYEPDDSLVETWTCSYGYTWSIPKVVFWRMGDYSPPKG